MLILENAERQLCPDPDIPCKNQRIIPEVQRSPRRMAPAAPSPGLASSQTVSHITTE